MTRKITTFALALTAALIGTTIFGADAALADCYWPVYRSW